MSTQADLLYEAWCLIANARSWDDAHADEWEAAKVRWRDAWHATLHTPGPDTERSPDGLVERVADAAIRFANDEGTAADIALAVADWLDEQFRVSVVQQAACEWAADLIRREVEGSGS